MQKTKQFPTSFLMKMLVNKENLEQAVDRVRTNKGRPGPDGMETGELKSYFEEHGQEVVLGLLTGVYKPSPVRRVYIPKPNGKKRPLGIPNVIDRVIQQALTQVLVPMYEPTFHPHSYGFRPGRSAQDAVMQAVEYLDEGYEWMIDLDIEKFFDRVNHDKLISIIRETTPEPDIVFLIRKFLKAGYMENGVVNETPIGTPQGGNISPLLANIYLNKLDWELEARGLRHVRYADDVCIFTKSEAAANRVMASISSWIERKLFLKVSPTKTKVVKPPESKFLGFMFYKDYRTNKWECAPHKESKVRLRRKIKEVTCRRKAAAGTLNDLFFKLGQVLRGWINYYCIGRCKTFLENTGMWLRHRVRVVILKQWKTRKTIYRKLCEIYDRWPRYKAVLKKKGIGTLPRLKFDKEYVIAQCYTRCGWYRLGNNNVTNVLLHKYIMQTYKEPRKVQKKNSKGEVKTEKVGGRYALVNPLDYYLMRRNELGLT